MQSCAGNGGALEIAREQLLDKWSGKILRPRSNPEPPNRSSREPRATRLALISLK